MIFIPFQVGSVRLVKLPGYTSNVISIWKDPSKSRSFSSNIFSLITKSVEYFVESHAIKIPLPSLSKNFPGIIVEENTQDEIQQFEGEFM